VKYESSPPACSNASLTLTIILTLTLTLSLTLTLQLTSLILTPILTLNCYNAFPMAPSKLHSSLADDPRDLVNLAYPTRAHQLHGRPFGNNRYGPKSTCCWAFFGTFCPSGRAACD